VLWTGVPELARWYAAYTYARHEKQVRRQREEGDIRCFLPLYRSIRRWKDRHKELELVLFPGYIFVHVGPKARLFVLQTPVGCAWCVSRVIRLCSKTGRLNRGEAVLRTRRIWNHTPN
jgi:transcription antitermination factor NusG